MTRQEIAERNAQVVSWYSKKLPMRRIVARTRLGHRQIYRILVNHGVEPRGWQDKRLKRNGQ